LGDHDRRLANLVVWCKACGHRDGRQVDMVVRTAKASDWGNPFNGRASAETLTVWETYMPVQLIFLPVA
jgi:hypothetical protein